MESETWSSDRLQESRSRPGAGEGITNQSESRREIPREDSDGTGRADFSRRGYLPVKIAIIHVIAPINQGAISQNDNDE